MTENERTEQRALKVRMVERLSALKGRRGKVLSEVWKTDERLKQYVKEVARWPEKHNVWEICAVVRFLEMVTKYHWHVRRAQLVIRMLETLRYQTDDGLRRITLRPVQVFMVAVPFGLVKQVKVESYDDKTGRVVASMRWRRVIRSVVWMVPRKFGKTTLIAGLGVTEFLFGPSDAEVDVVSTTGRQAKICYNMIKTAMMDLVRNDVMLQDVKLRFNRESMFYENPLDGAQRVNVFGDNPDALNGLKPSMAIEDESASMADTASKSGNESRNTLESGQGPRLEPLSFQITTASKYVNGPFARSLIGIKDVLSGKSENDQLFAMLFCPDVDDEDGDPATWRKCHPMLGETVQADYYEREWQRCKDDATYLNEFRTKLLNVFDVGMQQAWISGQTVGRLMVKWNPLDMPFGSGVKAMVAVDLAKKWDFTAVSVAIYREDIRQIWVHTKCFLPDGSRVWVIPKNAANDGGYEDTSAANYGGYGDTVGDVEVFDNEGGPSVWKEDDEHVWMQERPMDGKIYSGHPNAGLYAHWIESGEIVLTHGTVVDYDVVAEYIWDVAQHLEVVKIGYDDYKWNEFANYLARRGGSDPLVAFGQTYGDFTSPTIFFERGVERGDILLAESEVVRWAFDNAILDVDSRGNVKPMKVGDFRRIDPVITSVMACGLWSDLGHTRHTRNNFEE